jgi:hypothetical protein
MRGWSQKARSFDLPLAELGKQRAQLSLGFFVPEFDRS